jgi:beta-glucosidase
VGSVSGKEAILLYSSDLVASMVPDNKRLRNFQKIELASGEQKTITFRLPAKNLSFVGEDEKWRLEEGDFLLKIGKLSQKITCTATKVWNESNI